MIGQAVTTREAAAMLGISPRTLQATINQLPADANGDRWLYGTVRVWHGGRGWRLSAAHVARWIDRERAA
jgi:hypothetical protein